ncbi:hypothetical protein D3C72_749510 [compost metagenome]
MVDLPTPPLPEATAITFFTPGSSFTPRCTAWATIFMVTATLTLVTPGRLRSAPITSLRIGSNWLLPG